MKAIDLFCGAGGLTVGLKMAGFDVISAVEKEPIVSETYMQNHPDVSLYTGDIRELSPKKIMIELGLQQGQLDLLAGCPPCQGFSSLRTRNKYSSVTDERNDLIFSFLEFVKYFLPKVVMLENVPALAKDYRMKIFCDELKQLGYFIDSTSVAIEDASNYGVPQRRRRMVMLASRLGYLPRAGKNSKKVTVKDVIGDLPLPQYSDDFLHNIKENRSEKVMNIIKLVPKDGGSRSDLPYEYWLPCHKKYPNGFRDVYGRMKWDAVSPTITSGCTNPSKGRFLHPVQDRAITLREAALLQTFPKDYYFPIKYGKDRAALMIGNALPPEFIKRHAEVIKKHLIELG
ncbi:DNA cytosine methyltransferase [Escherichia coli]|nr:DNA cytosine methyltransferase [Escherichia coli]EEY8604371.1 DNA cytosine methyltransferase [Escherichia coli]EFF2160466.1 DNA cytosine methyltransferase [Escherichia coli]EFG3664241.1 DNA cytosine methyltransferase [Escherichia coli]EFG8672695.1 DNA cytosine methyltransferase [Escherichia coli]